MYLRLSSPHHLVLILVFAGAPGLVACGPGDDDGDGGDDPGDGECAGSLLAGDLVISEVLANPAGEDSGNEYIEIYNATTMLMDLSGMTLAVSGADDAEEDTHTMGQASIEPGDYLVVGDGLPGATPDHVDYGYGNDIGMRNAGARISLRCGGIDVDSTEYPSAESDDGISYGLDGNVAPDSVANDSIENFCASTTEFAPGQFGSPGEANEPCNTVVPGTCNDGGTERPTVSPDLGDLVITEFMANPDGADTGKEWFELYVAADVDLNGVVAGLIPGSPKFSVVSPDCVAARAGSYVLLAGTADPKSNGGLPPVDHAFNFTIKNGTTTTGPGSLFVGIDDAVLDAITYEETVDGRSTALDPAQLDPAANDDQANWFTCDAPYGTEANRGTPAADNATCDVSGQCREGDVFRPTVPPAAGDIRITESLSDPALTGNDATQEWFEVEALAAFDLNGLELGENLDGDIELTIESVDCLPVAAGTFLIFAHETKNNGGLPRVDQRFDFALNQDGGRIFVGVGGAILDEFSYGTTRDAIARALSADGTQICDAEVEYGDAGNFGSPGATNPDSATQCTAK